MAIACSPATPTPSTTTFAGGTVPAAVIASGKNRGSRIAASSTARYPAASAWLESTSIACAREERGSCSKASGTRPASASAARRSPSVAPARPSVIVPGRSAVTRSAGSGTTCTSRSASRSASASGGPSSTAAPAAAYCSSG